jgi:hypothetical protein
MIAAIARRLAADIGTSAGKGWAAVALGLSDKAVVRRVEHARAQPDESRRSAREWQELRGVWRVGLNPAFDAFQAGRATNVVIVTETRKSCWDLGGEGADHTGH